MPRVVEANVQQRNSSIPEATTVEEMQGGKLSHMFFFFWGKGSDEFNQLALLHKLYRKT